MLKVKLKSIYTTIKFLSLKNIDIKTTVTITTYSETNQIIYDELIKKHNFIKCINGYKN